MYLKLLSYLIVFCSASPVVAQEEELEFDPLAELAALGEEAVATGPEGGGSIRAKKDIDLSRQQRIKDPKNIEALLDNNPYPNTIFITELRDRLDQEKEQLRESENSREQEDQDRWMRNR